MAMSGDFDPIAAAVEGVCDAFSCRYHNPCGDPYCDCECKREQWRHWLRALREQLAETERERDAITEVLNSLGIETIGDMLAGAITSVMEDRTARLREALEKYGRHDVDCDRRDWLVSDKPCNCGLAAALARTHPEETSDA